MTGRPCFMRSCCGIFGRFHIVRHFLSMSQFHHLNKRGNYMTPGGLFQGLYKIMNQFSSVAQSCPTLCDPCIAACQASLFITNSWSLLKLVSIKLVLPSNHLILCHPLLLLPSIFLASGSFPWVSSSHQMAKVLEFSASPSVLPMNIQD